MTGADLHWEKVTTLEAVQFLTGSSGQYFKPFLARENTVAEVAREMQLAPNKLLYHVQKAVKLGLLRVTHVQKRAGKPIKTYRSSADVYFVPFESTPSETLESWLMPLEDEWHARWVRSAAQTMRKSDIPFGLRWWRAENNEVMVKPTPAPPVPVDDALLNHIPVLALWAELKLNKAQAQTLHAELLDLYERYARISSGAAGQASHLLHLAVTPVQP